MEALSPGLRSWPWFPRGLPSVSLRPLFARCALGTRALAAGTGALCVCYVFFCYFLWGFFGKLTIQMLNFLD